MEEFRIEIEMEETSKISEFLGEEYECKFMLGGLNINFKDKFWVINKDGWLSKHKGVIIYTPDSIVLK